MACLVFRLIHGRIRGLNQAVGVMGMVWPAGDADARAHVDVERKVG